GQRNEPCLWLSDDYCASRNCRFADRVDQSAIVLPGYRVLLPTCSVIVYATLANHRQFREARQQYVYFCGAISSANRAAMARNPGREEHLTIFSNSHRAIFHKVPVVIACPTRSGCPTSCKNIFQHF